MSETEHEHEDDGNEPPEPVSIETAVDDEEAAEAEAEHEREQEATEPVPEARETTPEQWEERFKKVERRFATYTKAVTDIWEDDAIHLTPFSISPSAPPGFIDLRDAGRVDEDTKASALQFLGFAVEQDYAPDPEAQECSTCKGKGLTATGSKVGSNVTRDCPTVSEQVGPLVTDDTDNWGEPRILPNGERNENFGKMPQFKTPHPTYGITALLTQEQGAF